MKKRLAHLPSGLLAAAVLLVLGVVLGGWWRGPTGAAGAAAGVILVAASYTVSSLAVAWADRVNPRLVMPVGLTTYVVKFTAIGFGMAAVAGHGWAGLPAMGLAVIVSALGWITAQAVWTWRARIPYVDING
jgi:hypothetical protein